MRTLSNAELQVVAGGDIFSELTPDMREYYDNWAGGFFDKYSFAASSGKGTTTVASREEAIELIRAISESLPKGEASCTMKASGSSDGPTTWSVECSFKISRK